MAKRNWIYKNPLAVTHRVIEQSLLPPTQSEGPASPVLLGKLEEAGIAEPVKPLYAPEWCALLCLLPGNPQGPCTSIV